MEQFINDLPELLMTYGWMLLWALVILILGIWISNIITSAVVKMFNKREIDQTVVKFLSSLIKALLYAVVILATLGQLGIETTSFIALIGAAGLAVGFALQGSLSNFAAGVMLIVFRPFKVGDYITAGGENGSVEAIQMFVTTLKTPDNKTIFIPNSKITGDNIVNFSTQPTRRVDMVFGIGYTDDIDKAKSIIRGYLENDPRVLKDPPVQIAVSELADSSVNIVARPWVYSSDYWNVYFDTTENIKKEFDSNGISIPFPQRDVHLYQKN
ncbi:MAG: mechanosensitive ion channel [Melioribacteraceae bacterium]|nr:mechanosensitive ion channel [Melioribacteraceae bacterium]